MTEVEAAKAKRERRTGAPDGDAAEGDVVDLVLDEHAAAPVVDQHT